MSNLLEKASIITTPTAYSDGVLHSVKPEQTLGSEWFDANNVYNRDDSVNTVNPNSTITTELNTSSIGWSINAVSILNQDKVYKVEWEVISTNSSTGTFYAWNGVNSVPFGDITESGSGVYYLKGNSSGSSADIRFNAAQANSTITWSLSIKEVINADFTFTRNDAGTRVNASGNIESVGVDLPRIDYLGGIGSWLLEPQSTNLFLNSETLSTQDVTTTSSTYTVSFYGTGSITFTGTHIGVLSGTGLNDKVTTTFTSTSGTLTCTVIGSVKFGQLEELSYATSYIPTSGSTVTRGADSATDAGSSDLISSTEGVLYLEVAALTSINSFESISLSDSSTQNRIRFQLLNTLNRAAFQVQVGGVSQMFKAIDTTDITNFNKIAIKYKQNDFSVWLNGVKIYTDTSGTIPTLSELNFTNGSNSGNFNGKVKCVAVFKEALTDAELTCLTTI